MGDLSRISVELLPALQRKEPWAWKAFRDFSRPIILSSIKKRTALIDPENTTENVLLKIFAGLTRKKKPFVREHKHCLRTWVCKVAYSVIASAIRKQQQDPALPPLGGKDAKEQLEQWLDSQPTVIRAGVKELSVEIAALFPVDKRVRILTFRDEAKKRITGRLRNVKRLQAFLLITGEENKPKDVSKALGITPNHASVATKQILEKLKPFLCERMRNYLNIQPGTELGPEQLKDVSPAAWTFLSKEMGLLLDDLWAVVDDRKNLLDVKQPGLRSGRAGQVKGLLEKWLQDDMWQWHQYSDLPMYFGELYNSSADQGE